MSESETTVTLAESQRDCTENNPEEQEKKKAEYEKKKAEYEKKKAEYEKKKAEYEKKKKEETILLVLRQTDYDREMAIKKMEEWENNYIHIIKEFIDPKFKEKYSKKSAVQVKSINQNVMGEIRHFMDDVNRQYTHRKRVSEHRQEQQNRFIAACRQKLTKQIEKVKENWPDAPDACWKDIELQKLLFGYKGNGDLFEVLYDKTFCDFHFGKK